MLRSLVGSEMCIRDSFWTLRHWVRSVSVPKCLGSQVSGSRTRGEPKPLCVRWGLGSPGGKEQFWRDFLPIRKQCERLLGNVGRYTRSLGGVVVQWPASPSTKPRDPSEKYFRFRFAATMRYLSPLSSIFALTSTVDRAPITLKHVCGPLVFIIFLCIFRYYVSSKHITDIRVI